MTTFLRTIEFLSLSLWLGADAFLSFVVAPGAFAILGNRDAAGVVGGVGVWGLHFAGGFLGVGVLVARVGGAQGFGSFAGAGGLCGVLVGVLTAGSRFL